MTTPTTVRPAIAVLTRHCPIDRTEWNGIDGTGCWFCGHAGLPGRVPKEDGRSSSGMPPGSATWKAREADK